MDASPTLARLASNWRALVQRVTRAVCGLGTRIRIAVKDLCETLEFKELFRYRFKKTGHINVLESRVYKSRLKHSAKRWSGHRLLGLLDSRVTMGASATAIGVVVKP